MKSEKLFNNLVFKVGIFIIIVEIAVLSITGFYYLDRFSTQVEDRIERQLSVPGMLINAGLLSYDAISEKETIANLVGEELHEGLIIGTNGNIFNSMNPQHIGKSASSIGIETDFLGKDEKIFRKDIRNGLTELISIAPIYAIDGRTPFLYSYIAIGTEYIEKQKTDLLILFVFGSLACIISTSVAIIFIFNRLIFRKLAILDEAAEAISKGDLERSVTEGLKSEKDEIGTLAASFDSMRNSIKSQRNQLQDINKTLEEQVKERTKELEEKNVELERFNKLAVGRELKMIEMKKKLAEREKK